MVYRGVILSIFLMVMAYSDDIKPRIRFFPQEAYLNEPVTFGLTGKRGWAVSIALDKKTLYTGTFTTDTLEASLRFPGCGSVTISSHTETFQFELVSPTSATHLTLRDGYVYSGKTPAILAIAHKHPPKHNRTWEVVSILKNIVGDTRKESRSILLVGGNAKLKTALDSAGVTTVSTAQCPEQGDYEIDRAICESSQWTAHANLLFVLNGKDLELGLSEQRLRMRLEWLLQRCQEKGALFVTSISQATMERAQHSTVNRQLKLAALSNKAVYLAVSSDSDIGITNDRILKALRTKVILK